MVLITITTPSNEKLISSHANQMKYKIARFACFLTLTTLAPSAYADTFPALLKLGVINTNKLLEEVKPNIKKANTFLGEVANNNAIDVIYEEAAYVASDGDITEAIINGMKLNTPSANVKLNFLKIGPTVAVVNAEKIFTESKQAKLMLQVLDDEFKPGSNFSKSDFDKRKLALRTVIAKNINPVISEYAVKQGITLILQEAAFVTDSHNITSDLIQLLDGEKTLSQIPIRPEFSRPTRLAVVSGERIFANFEKNKSGSQSERIKDRTEIAKNADVAMKAFAAKFSVNIISQRAVFVSPPIDATSEVINQMTKEALAIQPLRPSQ
jgi:Skp family chaperone for outer membrane proteins